MNEHALLEPAADPRQGDLSSFLSTYRRTLRRLFGNPEAAHQLATIRGLAPALVREVWECRPLTAAIPSQYGGRGDQLHEFMGVLAASSYESLPLSLVMGINGGLFLQPLTKYGAESIKEPIFRRFIEERNMGGLMITEPDYGSEALSMQTYYVEHADHYHIRGVKHWAGLTGRADYWIVAARRREANGRLGRDIDFFVCDDHEPEQKIQVEALYRNLGLSMIPYGRNRVDVRVPKDHRLIPESSGIRMMLDTLYRSRSQFPGMALGFLKRAFDEALAHCRERSVGGRSLVNYDQVQDRLARLQAAFTACSAMCAYSSEHAGVEESLWKDGIPANAIKSVVTDLMHDAAQSLLQLTGAKGYRLDHIAGRGTIDTRPFQIFEGSNDILYHQVSEAVLKSMRRVRQTNLYQYLHSYSLTERASDYFKELLNFDVDPQMPQRKLVELGQLLGRVISIELTIELGERGFRSDMIANCLTVLRQDVERILATYRSPRLPSFVEDYMIGSSWLNYLRPQRT
jgi:alkylation response protein AidB-like acyl-CoA dehydrogenase